jgi:hypothetical protein
MVGNPEATGNLKDRHAGCAASRISSILNGRANQFGWLQAYATKLSPAQRSSTAYFIGIFIPADEWDDGFPSVGPLAVAFH